MLREENEAARAASRTPLILSGLLLCVVVVFLSVNYFRLTSELTAEKLSQSVREELVEVSPSALRELQVLGQALLPVYSNEWMRQLQEAWPTISLKLRDEMYELGTSVVDESHRLLAESEARVFERSESLVFASYPGLQDPEQQQRLQVRIHEICDNTLAKVLMDFDSRFAGDVERLRETVMKFDVTDTDESMVDLQKKFLRLWLQILDQEIMEL